MRIRPAVNNGKRKWCLDARDIKKGRIFFDTKIDAETEMSALSEQVKLNGEAWIDLAPSERVELLAIAQEIKEAGLTIRSVWDGYKAHKPVESRTLDAAIDELLESKRGAKRKESYIIALQWTLVAFARGREQTAVNQITAPVIEMWFSDRNEAPQTRQGNQSRLSTLFEFCVRRGYIQDNPCRRLESISIPSKAPTILTVDQCKKAVAWTIENQPTLLSWLIVSLFVGLRPKAEADHLTWNDIDTSYKRIHISKSRMQTHWRIIDLKEFPNSITWLAFAKSKSSPLGLAYVTRRRYMRKLRDHLGFDAWPQDILRHTAASYLYAFHQDAGKVAALLGNSPSVLMRRYRALAPSEEARKFFAIKPSDITAK